MKTCLVIGIGRFGRHLCEDMAKLGNEIMAVDIREELLEGVLPFVTSAKIGDCTKEEVLKSLGIDNFDICFVCIGTNFQSSLEITSLLKEFGANYVVSKASRDIHAKFLLRNGADQVIYPDRDIAEKMAISYSSDNIFDYFELENGYSIYEIRPLPEWIGKTILEVDVRKKYNINIVAVKSKESTEMKMSISPDYHFSDQERLFILGHNDDIVRLTKKFKS